ncbi:uncharacterized protein MELLADRAFT_94855 [Melampsora larici-populina 98AG31]|uniref:Uncharacterized protein n=1 Tax=Melampsora larici-populina (strain 98AG31 / pathotype 3-4-7) TaxID=747676 RepID=F4S862_MELLP|nr:uncharacterized protein MELLADRAFT_94855 [Melampsora larici-populina 98AG31]EGF99172.1 hypothetical protein MELLADRAFT_94855 [Melampsora larici-populina 98AG31]
MLECSSGEDDDDEELVGAKRKSTKQISEKPAKAGKKMNPRKILTHQLVDLAPYWDNKMTACFGYVPLTIFVPAWLLADKAHMANRKKQTNSCSDVLQYTGSRIPSEWRQSFLEWSTSLNLCVKYWRSKYNREDIALSLEKHYKNVLEMKAKHHEAWAPALRYNITHRTNVWSHTLEDGSLSDVGTINEELMEQAWSDSKANGDHRYIDNPYIIGGALENMCPWTGKYQVGWDVIGSNGMEQVTAVTGGRMLSHLAPTGRGHVNASFANTHHDTGRNNLHQYNENQRFHHESNRFHVNKQHESGRSRGRRGRGVGRGQGSRGGGPSGRGGMAPSATVLVNGVAVPKFGPGAFEALKAAQASGSTTQQIVNIPIVPQSPRENLRP